MRIYRAVVRIVYAVIFIAAGGAHIYLGRAIPDSYAVFGPTALLPFLTDLWASFVMPNIAWLTLILAAYQALNGVFLLLHRKWVNVGAWAIIAFLAYITIQGYGWPSGSVFEDLLMNRSITLVLLAVLLPVALERDPRSLRGMWRTAGRHRQA